MDIFGDMAKELYSQSSETKFDRFDDEIAGYERQIEEKKTLIGQGVEVLASKRRIEVLERKIKELISKMTVEEKISQLMYHSPAIERLGVPAYNWWNECLHGVARQGCATVFPQAIGLAASYNTGIVYVFENIERIFYSKNVLSRESRCFAERPVSSAIVSADKIEPT